MAEFCSQETLRFSEPIAGSAPPVKRYVFVGWPRGEWQFNPMLPKSPPAGFASLVDTIRGSDEASLRLFNRKLVDGKTEVIFCPEMIRVTDVPVDQLAACIETYLAGQEITFKKEALSGQHLFVCTHGIRDKCCAKFGFGSVRALRAAEKTGEFSAEQLHIWETTHLIGDRFAGTAIAFPQGQMFGRMGPNNAVPVIQGLLTQRIHAPCYRGNVFLDEQFQVCEALAQTFITDNDVEGEVSIERLEDEQFRVRIHAGKTTYSATLTLYQQQFEFYSNCTHLADGQVSTKLRWVPRQDTALEWSESESA